MSIKIGESRNFPNAIFYIARFINKLWLTKNNKKLYIIHNL